MHELAEWDSFYVIIGSAAGGLIGLQFVVITLLADRPPPKAAEANTAFATPTVVHFGVVLLIAALLRVPWPTMTGPIILGALGGAAGLIYEAITVVRMRSQKAYEPEFEDWLFHAIVPSLAYLALGAFALVALAHLTLALFGIAAASLTLLYTGIHNAWDTASYHVLINRKRDAKNDQS